MKQLFKSFWTDESGQGLTEYGIIIALVSLFLIAVLVLFRGELNRIFNTIVTKLKAEVPQ